MRKNKPEVTKPTQNEENAKNVTFPPRRKVRAEHANIGMISGSMYRADIELNPEIEWVQFLSLQEHEHLIQQEKYNYLGAISDYEHAMELLKAEREKSKKLVEALDDLANNGHSLSCEQGNNDRGCPGCNALMYASKILADYRGG